MAHANDEYLEWVGRRVFEDLHWRKNAQGANVSATFSLSVTHEGTALLRAAGLISGDAATALNGLRAVAGQNQIR